MNKIAIFVTGLLVGSASLYAMDSDTIIIRKAKNDSINQRNSEYPQKTDESSEEPAPLTEEEQVAIMNKMNLNITDDNYASSSEE